MIKTVIRRLLEISEEEQEYSKRRAAEVISLIKNLISDEKQKEIIDKLFVLAEEENWKDGASAAKTLSVMRETIPAQTRDDLTT